MSGAVLTLMGGAAGGGSASITVASQSISGFTASPTVASATYRLNSNGSVYQKINSGAYTLVAVGPNWCVPASQASNYECVVSVVSGSGVGGSSLNIPLALSTTREWLVQQSTVGVKSATINVGIRRIGDTAFAASNTVDLYAEAS